MLGVCLWRVKPEGRSARVGWRVAVGCSGRCELSNAVRSVQVGAVASEIAPPKRAVCGGSRFGAPSGARGACRGAHVTGRLGVFFWVRL